LTATKKHMAGKCKTQHSMAWLTPKEDTLIHSIDVSSNSDTSTVYTEANLRVLLSRMSNNKPTKKKKSDEKWNICWLLSIGYNISNTKGALTCSF
jgi:hypothetical protein